MLRGRTEVDSIVLLFFFLIRKSCKKIFTLLFLFFNWIVDESNEISILYNFIVTFIFSDKIYFRDILKI